MKFLVDTDIILSLGPWGDEDLGVHPYSAACFHRLAKKYGCTLFVHPLSLETVGLRCQGDRETQIKEQMAAYDRVDDTVPLSVFEQDQVGFPKKGSVDYLENAFLAAVKTDGVDFLVTEKPSLHARAGRLGLSTRVLFLSDALGLVKDLFEITAPDRPRVEEICFSLIREQNSIFWTMASPKEQDNTFKALLARLRKEQVNAFVIRDGDKSLIAGICVVEQTLEGPAIRLFHVADPYPFSRYGALLLKAVFDRATVHGDEQIRFSAFPGHNKIAELVQSVGFKWTDPMSIQVTPLMDNNTWVLPLTPLFHGTLFPELEMQLPLFPYFGPQGNAMERVCLVNTPAPEITPGDTLLIFRTQGPCAITAMGVVKETLVATSPLGIVRFLGTRTAWSYSEIVRFCRKSPLVIKFVQVKTLGKPLGLADLKTQGVLKGRPRKIMGVNNEAKAWLKEKFKGR
ncbi:putative GCN5-related N-acetyltransferase [Desulforapulum autotrophicum HRM2]|uniref:GCN5-related N-acetyltransferase n=1 Tax=Desulforapulum autotrophicum (strain ATCC 43914 / DSM 3382 / VKM B-1955 / HRM2) TaxID=177437 RepID=C0QFX5_DESAH|nr:hypothetical protein [Desulforapulum autotrophicum]ACN15543.1 putative GCN5-related N-acetyltransferase [Desulforapulum autotrophicum HRM2]